MRVQFSKKINDEARQKKNPSIRKVTHEWVNAREQMKEVYSICSFACFLFLFKLTSGLEKRRCVPACCTTDDDDDDDDDADDRGVADGDCVERWRRFLTCCRVLVCMLSLSAASDDCAACHSRSTATSRHVKACCCARARNAPVQLCN